MRWGEHPVLAFEGREWTNIDMQRKAARLAHGLVALGLAPGDRVVVLLPNCPEVLQAYAAILKLGGVIVPVVFLLSPEEVRHILADSGARIVVTAPELLARIEGWTGTVILVGDGTGARPWDEVVAGRPDAFPSLPRADGDLYLGDGGTPEGRDPVARQSRRQRARRGQPLRARSRALGAGGAAAVVLVRAHRDERGRAARHAGGAAALVHPRRRPRGDRAPPRADDVRRACPRARWERSCAASCAGWPPAEQPPARVAPAPEGVVVTRSRSRR